jgi:hypothetical protein
MRPGEIRFEHQWEEHSEPGTGNPPAPRVDPVEKDALEGWRRPSPPPAYEGIGVEPSEPHV